MKWVASHKTFTILASIIVVLTALLLASIAFKDKDNFIGAASRTVISIVQKPFVALGNLASDHIPGVLSDKALSDENKELTKKIEALEEELLIVRLQREELDSLTSLSAVLNFEGATQTYQLMSANVISYEGSSVFNIFLIDIGTEAGVKHNSAVVSGDGLVGRVIETGNGWSRVISIVDENNNVGIQVTTDGQSFIGLCSGEGDGTLTGQLLDENAAGKKGDLVFTSGLGGVYPPGILVGEITHAELAEESALMQLKIKPAANIKGLKKVAVLI
jgi:rod shape-determining protein MreC